MLQFGRPVVQWSSANIIVMGDSLPYGVGSTGGNNLSTQLAASSLLSSATIVNIASPGSTIANWVTALGGFGYNVDAQYNSAKKFNVILSWMGTNSIYSGGGMSGVAAAAQYQQFCAERLAVHSDYIIVPMTMIAREAAGPWGTPELANAELTSLDNEIMTNFRLWGCKGYVWNRQPGSPLILPDYLPATFDNLPYSAYEAAGETGDHTHLNNLGYSIPTGYAVSTFRYLPAR